MDRTDEPSTRTPDTELDQVRRDSARVCLRHAKQVGDVLHGADQMGMRIPHGIDRLRYKTPENQEGKSMVIYVPLPGSRDAEIQALYKTDGQAGLKFELVSNGGKITAPSVRKGIVYLSPTEAAKGLRAEDVRGLDRSKSAAVAWQEYLQAYLSATMNRSFSDVHVSPVTEGEDGSLYVTTGDANTPGEMDQAILRPGAAAVNVHTGGVDMGTPGPILDRINEIRRIWEEKREETLELEAKNACREFFS